jgi:hydroxyacylglutathione hydrolase
MITIHSFEFNPFAEKTYVLNDENNNCVIIDPGCYHAFEKEKLVEYIRTNEFHPVAIWLTHTHIDHIFGVKYITDYFHIPVYAHLNSKDGIAMQSSVSMMFGIPSDQCPEANNLLDNNDIVDLGEHKFSVIYCPGHSKDSIVFYNETEKFIIGGDVLFQGSIGRTDLPGGDFDTLIHHLKNDILTLPDDVTVYPGHGIPTNIREEKESNPFLQF